MSNASRAIRTDAGRSLFSSRSRDFSSRKPSNTFAARASTSALRASTPTVSNVGANGITPATEMNPCDGRYPQTPQLLAGARTDPPVSVPMAKSTSPQDTADADPLDEPPGTRFGAAAFNGVP